MNNTLKTVALPLSLIGIMDLTRFDHFGSALSLPDASLAVFFFAGLGCRSPAFLGLLLLEAGLIDYVAVTQFNVSDFCISSAYVFLIPAYAVLWFAGHYARNLMDLSFVHSLKMCGLAALSITLSFVISNGSFYLISDRIGELSLNHYLSQFARYYPPYLVSSAIYLVIGLAIIKLFKAAQSPAVVEP